MFSLPSGRYGQTCDCVYRTLELIAAYPEACVILKTRDLDYCNVLFLAAIIGFLQGPVVIHPCFLYSSMAQLWSVRNLLHYVAYGGRSRARQYDCCALEVSGLSGGINAEGKFAGVDGCSPLLWIPRQEATLQLRGKRRGVYNVDQGY